jgi:cell wall-associated NlpC family hydrolase
MNDNGITPARRARTLAAVLLAFTASAALGAPPDAARGSAVAGAAASARTTATAAAEKVWQGAQDVAVFALGLLGVSYRFGGETPERGVDCSGLIRYVFQEVTGATLPRTSRELSRIGQKVTVADLKPGDLVFFNTRRFAFSHVGLYLGEDRFIHAPATGREVEIANLSQAYWQKHFNGARRLVGVMPALMPRIISTAQAAPSLPAAAPATVSEPAAASSAVSTAVPTGAPSSPLLPEPFRQDTP